MDDLSETKSEKEQFQKKIKDCDPSYGMLDTCINGYSKKRKLEEKSAKLMQRMELDRPILQREKFEVIFLEKLNESQIPAQRFDKQEQKQFSEKVDKFIRKNFTQKD